MELTYRLRLNLLGIRLLYITWGGGGVYCGLTLPWQGRTQKSPFCSLSPPCHHLVKPLDPFLHTALFQGQCSVQEPWRVPGLALFSATKRPKVQSHCQANH